MSYAYCRSKTILTKVTKRRKALIFQKMLKTKAPLHLKLNLNARRVLGIPTGKRVSLLILVGGNSFHKNSRIGGFSTVLSLRRP